MKIENLRCDRQLDPLNIASSGPLLSWEVGHADASPELSRVLVSSSAEGLNAGADVLWDSGWLPGSTGAVRYTGPDLGSNRRYFWTVQVRDGDPRQWRAETVGSWRSALLTAEDWAGASWIGTGPSPTKNVPAHEPAPCLRLEFECPDEVVDAVVYAAGPGYYELSVNGTVDASEVLRQAVSAYDKTVLFDCIDITGRLRKGPNVLGVQLGNGFLNIEEADAWNSDTSSWRTSPAFMAVVLLLLGNGERMRLVSGTDWRFAPGPILSNGVRTGEIYDARRAVPGWDRVGFDDSGWQHAVVHRGPGGQLKPFAGSPIRVRGETRPRTLSVHGDTAVADFGVNLSGWLNLRMRARPGQRVTLRHGERLDAAGRLDTEESGRFVFSDRFQTDEYIARGEGLEEWSPRFTYHGFRYAEITGLDPTGLMGVTAHTVHSDLERRGWFACSDPAFMQIYECTLQSTLTNWHTFPTDCPQREKNGWTADGHLAAEQALYSFNAVNDYLKWLGDIIDSQRPDGSIPGIAPTGGWGYNWGNGPAWDSALIILPWQLYLFTGDERILADCLEPMRRYIGYLDRMADRGIIDFGLGDWCAPEEVAERCPTALSDTCYFYSDIVTLAKCHRVLGLEREAERLDRRAEEVSRAFVQRFMTGVPSGTLEGDCIASLALPLFHGVLPERLDRSMTARLVQITEEGAHRAHFGVLGAKAVLRALSERGHLDVAARVVGQEECPGWAYQVKSGATTLWETWVGDKSLNHPMFGSVADWFYRDLVGFQLDEAKPGLGNVRVRPGLASGLAWAEGTIVTERGSLSCRWERTGEEFTVEVAGTGGVVCDLELPDRPAVTLRAGRWQFSGRCTPEDG